MPNRAKSGTQLRQRAELALRERSVRPLEDSEVAPARLRHELEIHQVELEMQNEALRTAQLELEASRDRYHELYDLAPVAYVTLDAGGKILEANMTAALLLGVERSRLVGRHLASFAAPDDADDLHRYLQRVFQTTSKQVTEIDLMPGKGQRLHVHVEAVCARPTETEPRSCRCVLVDLSALRRAEQKLSESEERFRQIAECIEDAFYVRERDGRYSYVSPGYERLRGEPAAELDAAAGSWVAAVHPDDRERLARAEARLLQDGEPLDQQYRVLRSPDEVRFVRHRAYPVLGPAGGILRTVGVIHDETAERELEHELRHAQKMEAVGALASGVAHDFNNVLQAILGLASMAVSEAASRDDVRQHIEGIVRASKRGGTVAGRLMAFARRAAPATAPQDLDGMVRDAVALLRHLLTENIGVDVDLDARGSMILADPSHIEQILMNLATNARDAMPHGGTLHVETRILTAGELRGGRWIRRAERYVRLKVSDTGTGIDDATRRRIFEPFFTTKRTGKGTGLGLSSVFALTRQIGGHVEVDSEVGSGTSFSIELPATDVRRITPSPRGLDASLLSGKVLLVEDEPMVRITVRCYLEELGLSVIEAANGEEAQRLFTASLGSVRLLITDVVMPAMLGTTLAELLQATTPALRVLFITANPQGILAERLAPGRALLRKPFAKEELAEKLRELLG